MWLFISRDIRQVLLEAASGSKMKHPKGLEKVFRANLRNLDADQYVGLSSEQMAETHLELIKDILQCGKPVKSQLQSVVDMLHGEISKDERTRFVDSLWLTLQHCKSKSKSMTSGKKLQGAVADIAKYMKDAPAKHEGEPVTPGKEAAAAPANRSPVEKQVVCRKEPQMSCFSPPRVSQVRADLEAAFGIQLPRQISVDLSMSPFSVVSIENSPVRVSGAGSSSSGEQPPVQYVDPVAKCVLRVFADGRVEKATMSAGPKGFAMAQFHGEPAFESELPDVILSMQEAPKKGPATGTYKRPAARGQGERARKRKREQEEESVGELEEQQQESEEEGEDEEEEEEDTEHLEEGDGEYEHAELESVASTQAYPEEEPQNDDSVTERKFHGAALVKGQFSKQSYIQEKVGQKKLLVVAVSVTQSPLHKQIIQQIYDDLSKRHVFTKADAVNLRASMLER